MPNNIQTIIDKFKNTFGLNGLHAKPVEYMDYEDVTDKVEQFLKDSLTSMLDGIIQDGPQIMEHEDEETKEQSFVISEHNGCVYDFHKIINSHR